MIMNLEVTLEEMRKQAEEKGMQKGKLEGKLEVARAALKKGFSLEEVAGVTGLDRDTLSKLEDKIKAEIKCK